MGFLDFITDPVADVASSVLNTAEEYAKGFEIMGRDALYGVGDFFKYLPENTVGIFEVFKDEGKSLFDDLVHDVTHPGDFISDAYDSLTSGMADAGSAIVNYAEELPGDVYSLANWATDGVADDVVHDVSDAWDDVTGWL